MKVEVDLTLLEFLGLQAKHYVWLFIMYTGDELRARHLSPLNPDDYLLLEKEGYIKILGSLGDELNVVLRQKGTDLFQTRDVEFKWNEFKANYPIRAGERRLHDNVDKCKTKYFNYVISPGIHERIMLGLNNEKKARINASKKSEFFPDWKLMSSYLSQKHWETYVDYKEDIKVDKTKGI